MNLKLIDLFEIKYISSLNIKDRKKIENLFVHSVLNINKNIRTQFQLIISTHYNNLTCVHIFKKFLNRDNIWCTTRVQYISSFCLSDKCELEHNWRSLDYARTKDDYFVVDESYDRSILSDDYQFYIELKNNFKNFSPEVEKEMEGKLWGKTYHVNCIKWQIILGNIVTSLYGSGINEYHFRSKDFICDKLSKIYYPDYNDKSIIFKNFIGNKVVYCDCCHSKIRINSEKMYNHCNFGDICKTCFQNKKEKEEYRKNYFKRYILMRGRSELFKKKLEETRKFLETHKIIEFSSDKKYELVKKFTNNLLTIKNKKYECVICLEEMKYDIYAGSCGHCFHASCYFRMESNKCPLCRKISIFKKLHL